MVIKQKMSYNMNKTILELTNEEARNYFLQASKFCTIDLPKYFDFQPLLNRLESLIGQNHIIDITGNVIKPNDCEKVNYKFLTNKDGNFSWRAFQIINPALYICLINRITESDNWEIIRSRFARFQKNTRIKCYSIPLQSEEVHDQLKYDTSQSIINWWDKIEQQSIELALQYNCVLVTDITDCYGSIYTHSIGWALHGKETAREHRTTNPPTLIGCIIDNIIQSMSYRQTNGIPQGSVVMDFIAEMVLGYADYIFTQKARTILNDIDYKILRYRDDYRIFTNNQEDAVKITKLLSEVLSELNLKLNTQKTFVSNNIIRDVIKPDKLFWNEAKQAEKTLQKHLLLIHSLAEKYPNSGSVSTAMSKFIDRVYPLKVFKDDSTKVLVSILVDIAYNNPRTYPSVIVCLGKILSLEPDKASVEEMCELIEKRFSNKPNVGHWKVWFQRLTIKNDREKEQNSDEKLCCIAANKSDVKLWNIEWLKKEYQDIFNNTSIINEEVLQNTSDIPEKNEAQLFGY